MNSKTQILFLKRLAFLLNAGRSLHQSLLLSSSSEKGKLKIQVESLAVSVGEGKLFGVSLLSHKFLTDGFSLQIITLGEKTGELKEAVSLAATELEAKRNLHNKLIGSLLYPLCVVSGTLFIALGLVLFIFPKVTPVFLGLGVKLPFATRVLMTSIDLVTVHWFLSLASAVIVVMSGYYLLRRFNWRIPLVRNIWLSRTLKIIGLTSKNGMPIDACLEFCAETLKEQHYKTALKHMVDKVKEGEKLSVVLSTQPFLFPPLVTSFVSTAEMSGTLSEALLYLSAFYQGEIEMMTKRITELIEPVLMIVLGLCIGFVGVSLITPIYGITNHVTH